MKIAALSDLHGNLPTLPKDVDLIVLGGDLLWDKYLGQWARQHPAVQSSNLRRDVVPWLQAHGVPAVGTWGNHDWIGHGVSEDGLELYVDRRVEIGDVTFWFSPWSPSFMDWNWMLEDNDNGLGEAYAQIPTGIDVLVSHCPPHGYGDKVPGTHDDDCPLRWHLSGDPDKCTCGCEARLGSKELLKAIERVKPKVVICGHIHSGYGKYTHVFDRVVEKHTCDCEIDIYNVSVVDEGYNLVNPVTVIEL